MGLDSVELVMEVEKCFDIKIPDKECEKILTVGDFHDVVWKHIEGKYTDRCASQSLFYKIRTALHEQFGIAVNFIKTDAIPEQLFPKENRRNNYLDFANEIQLKLPSLVLTPFYSTVLNVFGYITILGSLLFSLILIFFKDVSKWTLLIPLVGVFATVGFSSLLDPKRLVITNPTMRAFINEILASNYSKLTAKGNNRREVEIVVNHIIADKCGVALQEVTPEKSITNDLGIE